MCKSQPTDDKPELHADRVDPRVGSTRGSGRVGPGQKIYKYEWVGSGPVR